MMNCSSSAIQFILNTHTYCKMAGATFLMLENTTARNEATMKK